MLVTAILLCQVIMPLLLAILLVMKMVCRVEAGNFSAVKKVAQRYGATEKDKNLITLLSKVEKP